MIRKHFLYHIFSVDKQENPMPIIKKRRLLSRLREILWNNKGEHRWKEKN